MNWRNPISGETPAYKRGDGTVTTDQRSGSFAAMKDSALRWSMAFMIALVPSGFGYLAYQQSKIQDQQGVIQSQIAVLIERTSNQAQRVDHDSSAIVSLQIAQAEMQRQMDDLKVRR